ncbi:ABC transporter permease [Pseudoroseicyclus sp. CXY001]|uniref:ABC transporter permease n=1 Tax=Pseudoroseicyclus sp. CXY001 TaxID=3242492 RepID=UPI003570ACA9
MDALWTAAPTLRNILLALIVIGLALGLAALLRSLIARALPDRLAHETRGMPVTAAFGIMVIVIYILVAIFAPLIAPYPERMVVGGGYLPWSAEFPLGTDKLGRDMLSRLIFAARNTVGIAFATTLLAFLVGSFLGLWAALLGGWTDQILSRIVDALMAIPALIFSMLLLTIFGTSIPTLILVIATVDATRVFRLARSVAQGIVVMDYVEAALLRGEGTFRLIRREILPNALAPLVAEFGLRFCFVFLTISALSFLGLGIKPPTADWGSMVRENATLITFGDITPLLPAGAIALLTVAVNFVVDWQLHRASGLKD